MEGKVLYDSFNARYLTFQEVAESFIPNDYFGQLLENNHSLLMGPRGCGKTTLLKMLTPAALNKWDFQNKSNLFEEIPFYAIYIPTDIHWKKQLDQLTKDFKGVDNIDVIIKATVNTNIFVSVVKTFSYLIKRAKLNDASNLEEREILFSKNLIDNWKLQKPISPTLDAIEINLLSKVANINSEIRRKHYDKNYNISLDEYYFFEYYDLLKIAFALFEQAFPEIRNKSWALCFDELEIAPEWLQFELLSYLRSRDHHILFKLTTAPLISIYKEVKNDIPLINASERNDFRVIKIWTSNQKEFRNWFDFCHQLLTRKTYRKYTLRTSPEEIFGPSFLERVIIQSISGIKTSDQKGDFEENTPSWHVIKELSKIDRSFEEFLIKKGINPKNPKPNSPKQRDEVFRKIKQLAIYRYQFKKEGTYRRSRKIIPLYFGIPLIYELCDGNPRILVGLIDEFLDYSFNNGAFKSLSINEQSRVLTEISQNFISIISAHPDANATIKDRNYNLKALLETIGSYFHSRMIDEKFTMDPAGSFIVDEEINNKLLELLEIALYLGAIVYLDSSDALSNQGLIGKKFRLSFTLSPYFSLLSREFPSVQLSTILKRSNQPSLFS